MEKVTLTPLKQRKDLSADIVADRLREAVGPIPDAVSLT